MLVCISHAYRRRLFHMGQLKLVAGFPLNSLPHFIHCPWLCYLHTTITLPLMKPLKALHILCNMMQGCLSTLPKQKQARALVPIKRVLCLCQHLSLKQPCHLYGSVHSWLTQAFP